jgi:DNA mismatch repair ATPase MutS
VTFLYRLVPGACPKSYGVNVARLAGLPAHVLAVAAAKAAELEAQSVDANAPLNAEEMAALQRALQAVHMGDVAGACEAARAALGM